MENLAVCYLLLLLLFYILFLNRKEKGTLFGVSSSVTVEKFVNSITFKTVVSIPIFVDLPTSSKKHRLVIA
jgi:hypothetical protein